MATKHQEEAIRSRLDKEEEEKHWDKEGGHEEKEPEAEKHEETKREKEGKMDKEGRVKKHKCSVCGEMH